MVRESKAGSSGRGTGQSELIAGCPVRHFILFINCSASVCGCYGP